MDGRRDAPVGAGGRGAPRAAPLKACPCCGMVHRLPAVPPGAVARCLRCRAAIWSPTQGTTANRRARALALAALFLFPVAVLLPVMRIERFGNARDASIWSGAIGMLAKGELLVGGVVLGCSLVVPVLKLLGILALTSRRFFASDHHRARAYHWIERAGRWGMLDVLLIAVVVAWLKVGDLVDVRAGPAAWTFTACVILSLLASACFDPHALWLREGETHGPAEATP